MKEEYGKNPSSHQVLYPGPFNCSPINYLLPKTPGKLVDNGKHCGDSCIQADIPKF